MHDSSENSIDYVSTIGTVIRPVALMPLKFFKVYVVIEARLVAC